MPAGIFQAGADIRWLGEAAAYPPDENYAASIATTRAMQLLNEFPKPTIALVHGGVSRQAPASVV